MNLPSESPSDMGSMAVNVDRVGRERVGAIRGPHRVIMIHLPHHLGLGLGLGLGAKVGVRVGCIIPFSPDPDF